MQLNSQDPAITDRLTIKEFIETYHPTLKRESIAYARKNGKVDAVKDGNRVYILLTDKTKSYKPNLYKGIREVDAE